MKQIKVYLMIHPYVDKLWKKARSIKIKIQKEFTCLKSREECDRHEKEVLILKIRFSLC